MYFIGQLSRKEGKHYQRIEGYLSFARIETNFMTNTGPATWEFMAKIMKEIKLDFWAKALTIIRKTFCPKKNSNPMEFYISEEKSYLRTMKQIILPSKQISIRNPEWQTYSWDIGKLKNTI